VTAVGKLLMDAGRCAPRVRVADDNAVGMTGLPHGATALLRPAGTTLESKTARAMKSPLMVPNSPPIRNAAEFEGM